MPGRIIVLSGPIAAGKTELGDTLITRYGFHRFKTRELIVGLLKTPLERKALQAAGERLDKKTKGRWVAKALGDELAKLPETTTVIVDAARLQAQVDGIRESFGNRVVHIHVTAPREELARRYARRKARVRELASYDAVRQDPTERAIEDLAPAADIRIDTQRNSPEDVVVRVASHLGLYGRGNETNVDVIVGAEYGSEGKGHIASYLAPEYQILMRVGGPNAGHTVFEEPVPYKFQQLPSGTRCAPNTTIVLGPGTMIWPATLLREISECEISTDRLAIDPKATIIDKSDRTREERTLKGTIGSTAQGVGFATARKVLRTAAKPPVRFAADIKVLRPYLRETTNVLENALRNHEKVLLEGTQGTGLSLHHGPYPYVTSRETSVSGCLAEAGIAPSRVRRTIMVTRTYPIRVQSPTHGTSGTLTKELSWAEISRRSKIPVRELRKTEKTTTTRRQRRVGEFEWTLFRRAATLNGPTDIALTFADYFTIKNRDARRFDQLDDTTIRFIQELERVASCPVSLIATQFAARSIIDRRAW